MPSAERPRYEYSASVLRKMTRGDKGELFIRFVPLFTLSLFSKIVCSLWSCDKIKREIARRDNKKSLEIMYDGFYLTRGYHASSASGTIHDVKSGKIVAFAHRSKKGLGSSWVGTSGGAEGDIFEELLTGLKDEHFNVKECTIDHDATCATSS